jgi:hypothetical protein
VRRDSIARVGGGVVGALQELEQQRVSVVGLAYGVVRQRELTPTTVAFFGAACGAGA